MTKELKFYCSKFEYLSFLRHFMSYQNISQYLSLGVFLTKEKKNNLRNTLLFFIHRRTIVSAEPLCRQINQPEKRNLTIHNCINEQIIRH